MASRDPFSLLSLLRLALMLGTIVLFVGGFGLGLYWTKKFSTSWPPSRAGMWPLGLCLLPAFIAIAVLMQSW